MFLLCRQHPWFTIKLPRYLAVMQADTVATASVVDQDLVDDVAALGFDREYVLSSLSSRLHNKVTNSDIYLGSQQSRNSMLVELAGSWPPQSIMTA